MRTLQEAVKLAMSHLDRAIDEPNNTMSDGKALKEIMRQLNLAKAVLGETMDEQAELTNWQERAMVAEAALAKLLDAQQEPEWWFYSLIVEGTTVNERFSRANWDTRYEPFGKRGVDHGGKVTKVPLYTRPQAREPLEGVIDVQPIGYHSLQLIFRSQTDIAKFKAAHGIGEKK